MSKADITERTETRALLAWHAAFEAAGIDDYDWRIERIGDAVCSISSTDPSILLNRVFELGADGPPGLGQLSEEISNPVEDFDIRTGVGTGRATNGRLVDGNHLVEVP